MRHLTNNISTIQWYNTETVTRVIIILKYRQDAQIGYCLKTLSSAKVDLPSIKQQRVTISATTEYQNVALGFAAPARAPGA